MFTKNTCTQEKLSIMILEDIVPQDNIFRKIDKYIDFNFIYDEVVILYCHDNGRPSIDPVVLLN